MAAEIVSSDIQDGDQLSDWPCVASLIVLYTGLGYVYAGC
jgi:hypothetical protein